MLVEPRGVAGLEPRIQALGGETAGALVGTGVSSPEALDPAHR